MKTLLLLCLSAIAVSPLFGQPNLTEQAQPIVAEGKLLYKSEMASWYGTDLFLLQYKNEDNIGGYFSYTEGDTSKCIFYSEAMPRKVIGTIVFNNTFDVKSAQVLLTERDFSTQEAALYTIRERARMAMRQDTLFKTTKNANLNIIPLIEDNKKQVYVLSGPKDAGVVIFGNDYLITFNDRDEIVSKRKLHNGILPFYYKEGENADKDVVGGMHTPSPATGDFITATDICTLMLYAKFAHWKIYSVISEKYINSWNCDTNTLTVFPVDIADTPRKAKAKKEKKQKKNKDASKNE